MSSQQVAANIPSTQQAVTGIDKAQDYLAERASGQGAGAEKTVADINQALKDAKTLVKEKDLGDAVSKLVLDAAAVGNQAQRNAPSTQGVKGALADAKSNVAGSANVNQVSRDAHEAANQIRRIAQLTVTSPAFRRFLWNYYTVLRDSFGPQVDQAVEQRLKEGRKDDLTRKAERKARELRQQANQQQGQAQARKDEVAGTAQYAAQAAKQGDAKTAITETRDKAQELVSQAKQTLDQQLPKERREELVQRWQSLQREVQDDPNLRAAIEDLKSTIYRLRDDVQPIVDQASQKASELKQVAKEKGQEAQAQAQQTDTSGLQLVLKDARELLEKFADGKSMQNLLDICRKWAVAIKNDQELRNWANDLSNFVSVTKQDANKLNDDQHLQRLNDIIDRGRSLTQGKHKQIADTLLNESRDFLYSLRNDAASNRLRQSLNRVIEDLFVDNTGRFVVKPTVYKQLANALAPSFSDLFRDIRIAHIEEHNDDMDFALDNILIDASDIQPNQLDVTSIADVSLGKQDTGADLRFRISANGINPKIRNTYFRYERHAFPKISDFGSLDAALTGKGLSFNVDIEYCVNAKDNDIDRTFRCKDVSVDMSGLKLDFHNAKHETLYKIFKPLIVKAVTKQMENTIRDQIYDYVDQFDEAATDMRYRAADAIENAAGDRIVRGDDNNVGSTATRRL